MMDDRGCCPRSTSRVSLIRECHHSGQVNHLLTHGQSPQRPAPVFFVRFHTRRGFPRLSPRTKILQGVQGCLSSRSLVSWHKIIHPFWCSATTQLSTAVQWGASMFPQAQPRVLTHLPSSSCPGQSRDCTWNSMNISYASKSTMHLLWRLEFVLSFLKTFLLFCFHLTKQVNPEFCGWGKKANCIYSTKDHLLRVIMLHTCFSFSSCSLSTH